MNARGEAQGGQDQAANDSASKLARDGALILDAAVWVVVIQGRSPRNGPSLACVVVRIGAVSRVLRIGTVSRVLRIGAGARVYFDACEVRNRV